MKIRRYVDICLSFTQVADTNQTVAVNMPTYTAAMTHPVNSDYTPTEY